MTLIPLPRDPADAETRAVFERIAVRRGWVSNAMRALGAAPEGLAIELAWQKKRAGGR
jgi:hypothetical protein